MWDGNSSSDQIMTCETGDGGTTIVQTGGYDCEYDGDGGKVCVQSDTGAECEVPTAEEPDKCAPEGEAVMTSTVDAWNVLVWETTDCPDDTVCVPDSAACEVPEACPITADVPICDDGSYMDGATAHDLVT
jgi:hypothetical protein